MSGVATLLLGQRVQLRMQLRMQPQVQPVLAA